MTKRTRTKLVQEGTYVAEVEVELLETDDGWSPYLSAEEAYKLDQVRESLRRDDVKTALQYGRVFTLTPVAL
jgi:hypothetical protein